MTAHTVIVNCPQTGDHDEVPLLDYTRGVSLTVIVLRGTQHQATVTLKWSESERSYRGELWGRVLVSAGPRKKSVAERDGRGERKIEPRRSVHWQRAQSLFGGGHKK